MLRRIVVALSFVFSSVAGVAHADTPTEAAKVDKSKPQESAAEAPKDPPKDPSGFSQEAQGTLGALFTNGNADSLSGRVGGFYQFRYDIHQVRVEVGGGLASLAQDPDLDPANGFGVPLFDPKNRMNTAANGKLRYDVFVWDAGSVYGAGLAFHDSAANLAARLRADAGYRQMFFNEKKHALSAEVGAVYTIDSGPFDGDTNGDGITDLNDAVSFEKTIGTFGARLALSYTNALLDNLTFTTTAEIIPNIFPDVPAPFEAGDEVAGIKARVDPDGDNKLGLGEATIAVSNSTLTFNVDANLSLGVNLVLAYDNGAIARRNAYTNHDIAASFQLGYKLF